MNVSNRTCFLLVNPIMRRPIRDKQGLRESDENKTKMTLFISSLISKKDKTNLCKVIKHFLNVKARVKI